MSYEFQGMYFEDWEEGYELWTASRTVTEGDIMAFAGVSGDFNPLHTNEVFAGATPMKTRMPWPPAWPTRPAPWRAPPWR